MKQTPMQEAIDKLKIEREKYKNLSQVHTYDSCIKILTELLEKEEQQIIDFSCDVYNKHYTSDESFRKIAEDYYTETFKQK